MILRRVYLLLIVTLIVCSGVWARVAKPVQTPQSTTKPESRKLVDFEADVMRPIKIGDSSVLNLLGNVVFYHNGAVITCDSALRYSDKRMECFNNVVVNQNQTYIYGDRADYNGDINIARVYAPIIKMVDGDATMYTYNFSFNTLDNLGRFSGGATIKQKDNLLESERGYYYTKTREVICVERVEIKTPDYKIKTDSLLYNMDTELARFFVPTNIWNIKGEILSADRGAYNKADSMYYFTKNSYVLTKEQELWADSIDFHSSKEDAILRRNIQMRDDDNKVMAFGDFGQYWGQREEVMLTQRPSMVSFDPEQDSLFVRADSMFLYTISRAEALKAEKMVTDDEEEMLIVDESKSTAEVNAANALASDSTAIMASSTAVLTEKIAQPTERELEQGLDADNQQLMTKKQKRLLESEKKRLEKAAKNLKKNAGVLTAADKVNLAQIAMDSTDVAGGVANVLNDVDGTMKYIQHSHDSISMIEPETIAQAEKALSNEQKQVNEILSDSTAIDPADSMVRVVRGYFNVKIYRKDFQAVCDSLVGFSIDSTMHLYIDPVMWNENNQIKAEIIDVFSKNQSLDYALFTGDPIMSSQVDSVRYNQVKGKVIEALFKNNEIYRTNVNGNGQTLYYMTEDDRGVQSLMGFLVAECANITFLMPEKQIEQIIYRGDPVYTIYPMDKIPMDQSQTLPGFVWEIDRKPTLEEVFDRVIKPSRREEYEALPHPSFPLTEQIMNNRERMIKDGTWRDRNDKISVDTQSFIQGLGY